MNTKKRIDFDAFPKEEVQNVSGGLAGAEGAQAFASDSRKLGEMLNMVALYDNVWWVTEGEWSMHQLLLGLLSLTGPANVMISSYAMSETSARVLSQLKQEGKILQLRLLIDDRVDTRSPGSLQLLRATCDSISLIKTHAKVTLIQNSGWGITVSGSANYTENRRFETGVISNDPNAYSFNEKWMVKALTDGNK